MIKHLVTFCVLCGFLCTGRAPVGAQEDGPDPLCGAYTLYVSLRALDVDVNGFENLQQRLGEVKPTGYSLDELAKAAESYGAQTLGVETTLENLERRPGRFACIAHVGGNHFVNIADVEEGVVKVVDPPRSYELPAETFQVRWDGIALLISPDPLLAEEDLPRPLPWNWILVAVLAVLVLYTGWLMLRRRSSA